ncbi:alpha/beta hydrolase [Nocardia sp. JW2]|uniref:alpha/beta hydrolase n=1 Tax=Nocardia sp. JW2 TaxID=3450738 RepID=UPI003F42BEBB
MLSSVNPIRPYIQVTIGYVGEDARNFLRVRNRDLVPPGEPYPHQMADHLHPRVDLGIITEEQFAALLEDLDQSAADRFLNFVQHELHPRIAARWRVDSTDVGLFGYSYGALFSMYAFVTASPLFSVIGAGSPGILSPDSEIFRHYDRRIAEADRTSTARLHLTINDSELTSEFPLYRALASQYLSLADRIRRTPLPGMRVTAEVVRGETHGTGIVDAFRSFIRSCYSVRGQSAGSEIAWEPADRPAPTR